MTHPDDPATYMAILGGVLAAAFTIVAFLLNRALAADE